MEAGEAGSVRATAAGPSGALWWVSGTARGAPSSFPQRVSRAWMEMKPASGAAAALTLLASSLRVVHIYQISLYPRGKSNATLLLADIFACRRKVSSLH